MEEALAGRGSEGIPILSKKKIDTESEVGEQTN